MPASVTWSWLGRVPYADAHRAQQAWRERVLDGTAPSALWLLEHDPVVTVGLRPAPGTPPPDILAGHGIDWHQTERGGLATYHGPGQLVGYLLADVSTLGLGVRRTVEALEEALIDWLAEQGVAAGRRPGAPGVWVGRDKIAAIGLHFKRHLDRHVSMHGFALNLRTDLAPYGLIVPCGITDGGVTSLHCLVHAAPDPAAAAPGVARHVLQALGVASEG